MKALEFWLDFKPFGEVENVGMDENGMDK